MSTDTSDSRFQVDVTNEQTALSIDEPALRDTIDALLRLEHVAAATLSIAIVDDPTIHVLNRVHLAHDYPTDVLSFALHDEPGAATLDVPRGSGREIDGEVIVSTDTALARAVEFDWSPHDELLLYVVHGLLHVVGYDDRTTDERTLMRSREQAVLRERGIEPRYHEEVLDAETDPRPRSPTGLLSAGRIEFGEDS